MNKRYDVTLELTDNSPPEAYTAQGILYTPGDAETMPLYIHLIQDGAPFEPPSGALATLNFVAGELSWPRTVPFLGGNTALYEVDSGDIVQPGIVLVSVTVTAGAEVLTWQGFKFEVARNLADDQTEPPEAYAGWVQDMTQIVSELGAKVEDIDTGGGTGGQGPPGEDGLSAYELAVQEGFVGTLGEWLASLHGADGQDGAPGRDGTDGKDGEPGPPGADGQDGAPGRDGTDGKDGEPGPPGADGQDGPQGPAGEDGYTPQRGVDYWTENDRSVIVADVLAALPNGDEVGY